MSMGLWKMMVDRMPLGSTVLPFWRGESTMHPDFCEMISCLNGCKVVLATNGIITDKIIDVLPYIDVINVSIHNQDSYTGYVSLRDHVIGSKPIVIASMVEGERPLVENPRIYKKHSVDGSWGKVEEIPLGLSRGNSCSRLNETVLSWDGRSCRCCYVWDTSKTKQFNYPDETCSTCNQWAGGDRTL